MVVMGDVFPFVFRSTVSYGVVGFFLGQMWSGRVHNKHSEVVTIKGIFSTMYSTYS